MVSITLHDISCVSNTTQCSPNQTKKNQMHHTQKIKISKSPESRKMNYRKDSLVKQWRKKKSSHRKYSCYRSSML